MNRNYLVSGNWYSNQIIYNDYIISYVRIEVCVDIAFWFRDNIWNIAREFHLTACEKANGLYEFSIVYSFPTTDNNDTNEAMFIVAESKLNELIDRYKREHNDKLIKLN